MIASSRAGSVFKSSRRALASSDSQSLSASSELVGFAGTAGAAAGGGVVAAGAAVAAGVDGFASGVFAAGAGAGAAVFVFGWAVAFDSTAEAGFTGAIPF